MTEMHSILVIDDNPTDLKLVASVLTAQGYHVVAVDQASDGIEQAMAMKPALIILDVMMPIINGYNICRLLKDQPGYVHIPIVFLTSRCSDEDQRIGHEAGADAYITKPFDTVKLIETVDHLLHRSS